MSTIAQLLKCADEIDSDSPLLDAQVLLAHVLGQSRTYLYTWPEKVVAAAQCQRFLDLIERRKKGEPVAYLTASRDFWSLSLAVSPATLIPRADTELLVEKALELELPNNAQVLDLGTGTGAIALALASERRGWQVTAVDREAGAVELARQNVAQLGLGNVQVEQSDWFSNIRDRFDLIVSNPPYVADDDPHLFEGDVRFEPRTALVAADQGYADLHHIITQGRQFLASSGWLLVEHGADQGERVGGIFVAAGYQAVATFADLAGLPRVTAGQFTSSGAG